MPDHLMPEVDAIKAHLFYTPRDGGSQCISGLMAGLRDARLATGRNDTTGMIENTDATGSLLGALGYMAVLDQIGSCFKPKLKLTSNDNSVEKALTYFTDLQPKERKTLYALRCAFAHDYSLSNVKSKNGIIDIDLTHYFRVTRGSGVLVQFPVTPWSGDYDTLAKNNETLIDLEELGSLIEAVYAKLIELYQSDQLAVMLAGGSDELVQRYGFSNG